MLSRAIETLKDTLSEHRFYFLSIIFLLALLVYIRYENLILEKKRLEIEKELYQIQVKSERRQKAYDEKAKQQQAKIDLMIKEIQSQK